MGQNNVLESNSIHIDMDIVMAKCICDEQRTIRNSGQILSILENTDELLKIVPSEDYAAIINKKMFRGERLFSVLLEKASNYDCIQMHYRTTYKGLMEGQTLSYIIESIDGVDLSTYYKNNMKSKSQLPITQCHGLAKSDDDGMIMLKAAYHSGLVKLKGFGFY